MAKRWIIQTNATPKVLFTSFSTDAELNKLYGSSNWTDVTSAAQSMKHPVLNSAGTGVVESDDGIPDVDDKNIHIIRATNQQIVLGDIPVSRQIFCEHFVHILNPLEKTITFRDGTTTTDDFVLSMGMHVFTPDGFCWSTTPATANRTLGLLTTLDNEDKLTGKLDKTTTFTMADTDFDVNKKVVIVFGENNAARTPRTVAEFNDVDKNNTDYHGAVTNQFTGAWGKPAHVVLTRVTKKTFKISLKTGANGQQITGDRSVTVKSASTIPAVPFLLKNVQVAQDEIAHNDAAIKDLELKFNTPTKVTRLAYSRDGYKGNVQFSLNFDVDNYDLIKITFLDSSGSNFIKFITPAVLKAQPDRTLQVDWYREELYANSIHRGVGKASTFSLINDTTMINNKVGSAGLYIQVVEGLNLAPTGNAGLKVLSTGDKSLVTGGGKVIAKYGEDIASISGGKIYDAGGTEITSSGGSAGGFTRDEIWSGSASTYATTYSLKAGFKFSDYKILVGLGSTSSSNYFEGYLNAITTPESFALSIRSSGGYYGWAFDGNLDSIRRYVSSLVLSYKTDTSFYISSLKRGARLNKIYGIK